MDESTIPDDGPLDQGSNQARQPEHNEFGATQDTAGLAGQALAEKTTQHIIESFIEEGNRKLSSFLRKKISIESISMDTCVFDSLEHNYDKSVMLAFQIEPGGTFGVIVFDFSLLHTAINLLFGGEVNVNEPVIEHLGEAGTKIARKIAEICVLAFQKVLNEHLNTDLHFSNVSTSLYPVFNQKPDKACNVAFKVSIDAVSGRLWMVIPDKILANITSESAIDHQIQQEEMEPHLSGKLKEEIIESKIIICAVLADIALLVKDVVNLRAGDIIPIEDPTFVFVTHNQKKLFTATAGQLNLRRTVKIVDTI